MRQKEGLNKVVAQLNHHQELTSLLHDVVHVTGPRNMLDGRFMGDLCSSMHAQFVRKITRGFL